MAERTVPAGDTAPGSSQTRPGADGGPELIRRPDPETIGTAAEFAAALTRLREQAGVSVRDLARIVGPTSSTLDGWFAGRHLPPPASVGTVEKVLTACGVPSGAAQTAWIDALARVRRLPGPGPEDAPVPYRGLESYRAQDAPFFFGRERLVARLVALVTSGASAGPTVLVGPSGSGKTSALAAGLAARLGRSGSWRVLMLTPGPAPLAALDGALDEIRRLRLRPGSRVALIIDQFEELFTLCPDEADRQEFVRRIAGLRNVPPARSPEGGAGTDTSTDDTGPGVTALIALRAEFCGAALRYPELSVALQDRQVVAGPMSADDLRRAVTEPARAAGVQLEPGLAELVLHDMTSPVAGALPLMSYALLVTWQRGRRNRLRVEDYVAAGGLSGAVAAAAESVHDQLSRAQREAARRLFLRLVAIGDGGGVDTRRRVTAAELGLDSPEGDTTAEVLERFVTARLLTTSETTVEIAHEALLTGWPRLRGWLDGDRAGRVTHRRLTDAALTWQRDARDAAVLHRGGALITAREWTAEPEHAGLLNPVERDFLAASIAAHESDRALARRGTRRMRVLLAAACVLALLTGSLAGVALVQRSGAVHDRDQALSRQLAEAANRLRQTDPSVAGQIAVLAWRTAPTTEARSALLDSSAAPLADRLTGPGGSATVAASADGHILAAVGDRGGLRVWTLGQPGGSDEPGATATGSAVTADARPLYTVAVTRDGTLAVAGGASGVLYLWSLTSGRPVPLPGVPLGRGSILSLATSADGHSLAATTSDGHVMLYAVQGSRLVMLGGPLAASVGGAVQAVTFSGDSRALAAGGSAGRIQLWTLADRTHPAPVAVQLTGPTAAVTSLAYSPDGHRLAAGSRDQRLYVWQLATATAAPQRVDDAGSTISTVAFSPDGALLAAGSWDHHLRVYETSTRTRVADLPHPGPITNASYLPDGRTLVTGAADGLVRLWPSPVPTAAMPAGRTVSLGYLDKARLAAASSTDALRVFDVSQPYRPHPLGAAVGAPAQAQAQAQAPGSARAGLSGAMAVAPSGSLIAAGGTDGSVWLYDAAATSGGTATRLVATLPHPQTGPIEAVAFSPDGRVLATSSDDGTIELTDVSTPGAPRSLGAPVRTGGGILVLAFSPDGHRLAVGSSNPNRVTLWDVSNPRRISPVAPSPDAPTLRITSIAVSPDGRTVAVGSADQSVRLLDVSDAGRPRWLGRPLLGAGDDVSGVAFDRSGAMVAAASEDGTVRLWDLTDRSAPVLRAHLTAAGQDPLNAVTFDRTSGRLAAAGVGTAVWQWDLDPEAAARRVCQVAGAAIDADEWSRYLPGVPRASGCGRG